MKSLQKFAKPGSMSLHPAKTWRQRSFSHPAGFTFDGGLFSQRYATTFYKPREISISFVDLILHLFVNPLGPPKQPYDFQ